MIIRIPRHDPDIPEAVLERLVLAHVNKLPGVRLWKMHVGSVIEQKTGRKITFGVPGQADTSGLFLPSGRRLEIETKTPVGRQRPEQKIWQAEIERYGGLYILARSLEMAMVPICVELGLAYEIYEVAA